MTLFLRYGAAEALLYGMMQLQKKMKRSRQATLWYRK
jgi:NADH dehydrogenase (ubiquinone) Fe-S protein 7